MGCFLLPVGGVRWWIAGLEGPKQLHSQGDTPEGRLEDWAHLGWWSKRSTRGLSHLMVLTSFMVAGFPRVGTSRDWEAGGLSRPNLRNLSTTSVLPYRSKQPRVHPHSRGRDTVLTSHGRRIRDQSNCEGLEPLFA